MTSLRAGGEGGKEGGREEGEEGMSVKDLPPPIFASPHHNTRTKTYAYIEGREGRKEGEREGGRGGGKGESWHSHYYFIDLIQAVHLPWAAPSSCGERKKQH